MEVSNFITVAIVLALIIIPTVLVAWSLNKKKRGRAEKANKLRLQYQLNFSDSDSWDNRWLGLDKTEGKLLWFKEGSDGADDSHQLIDLRKMSRCKKVNLSRSVSINKEISQVIELLGLELTPKDANGAPVLLEFYSEKNSFIFNFQLLLLSKWHTLVESQLAAK